MKKFLLTLLAICLCAAIIIPVALASGECKTCGTKTPAAPAAPPGPATVACVDTDVDVHVDVTVTTKTCVHQPGCPHWWIRERIHSCSDQWSDCQKAAFKTSKEWARRGAKLLREVLGNDLKFKYSIHAKTANGWTELKFRNPSTGEYETFIMNAYTHYGACTPGNNHRVFAFTTKHLNNVKLEDYPDEYLLTDTDMEMEDAVFEFVAWLYDYYEM